MNGDVIIPLDFSSKAEVSDFLALNMQFAIRNFEGETVMFQKILAWLTAVYLFFAGLFGIGPKKHKPDPPTQADYVEVLEALKEAFAAGKYQAFVEQYPPDLNRVEYIGDEFTAWPKLLKGVTAVMTYDIGDFTFHDYSGALTSSTGTVSLQVTNGNKHLPSGEQKVQLHLEFCNGLGDVPRGVALYGMMLKTDGRKFYAWRFFGSPTLEEQIHYVTTRMYVYTGHFSTAKPGDWMTLPTIMTFLEAFEHRADTYVNEDEYVASYTEAEIIAGAKKYLGIDNYVPSGLSELVVLRDGKYEWGGIGFLLPPFLLRILDTPTAGDLTCRVFVCADYFGLEIAKMIDYNFLILKNPDNTEYAQLLSVSIID